MHGFEVVRGDDAHGDFGLFREGDDGMAFDGHGLVGTAGERQIVDCRDGFDSWNGADAMENLIEELRLLGGVGELFFVDTARSW